MKESSNRFSKSSKLASQNLLSLDGDDELLGMVGLV